MNENFDPEFDPTLDALIAFLGSIPQPAVKMLNLPVYGRQLVCTLSIGNMRTAFFLFLNSFEKHFRKRVINVLILIHKEYLPKWCSV